MDEAIAQLIQDDIIEPANSAFLNLLCIVLKSDGTARVKVDARLINSRTRQNHFRVEPVERQLERVNGAKHYSILDLSQTVLQIEMHESCRHYTAFLHREKQYRFKFTPFVQTSSGAALSRALDGIFSNELEGIGVTYVDDTALYSNDLDKHIADLDFVLQKFHKNGFTI